MNPAITDEMLADLLSTALEGGSNYWYLIEFTKAPSEVRYSSTHNGVPRIQDYPVNPGGSLTICDQEETDTPGHETWTLDRAALERGMELLHTKFPDRYVSFLSGDYDAEDADVFLQLCLFSEVRYG